MTRHFCIYFDGRYLFRALALYESMRRHCQPFTLDVLCLDAAALALMKELALPDVRLVPLAELEAADSELAATKADRKPHEYYWTCTPAWIAYLLERHREVDVLTYLDADMLFFADPGPVLAELGGGAVLLLEHRYSPQFVRAEERRGRFNVSLMPFRNDDAGRAIAAWWRARCIEWCYDAVEPGRFGDQKYLDDWPTRFPGTRIQTHKGGGLAPWNIHNYDLELRDGKLTVDGQDVLIYHFHSLRIVTPTVFQLADGSYRINRHQARLLYKPYVRTLRRAMAQVWRVAPGFSAGFSRLPVHSTVGGVLLGRLYRDAARVQPL